MPERLSVIFIIIKRSEWLNLTSVVKQHLKHSLVANSLLICIDMIQLILLICIRTKPTLIATGRTAHDKTSLLALLYSMSVHHPYTVYIIFWGL
jgi:hypothetical protein